MNNFIPVFIILGLILLNGLFVAAEFALIGVPRAAVAAQAAHGHKTAQLINAILNDPRRQDRYIATAQLGITVASLSLGMYGEHTLATWIGSFLESLGTWRYIAAHTLGSIIAITILTYFHIVLGEMVPKSLALQQAERTVLWVTPPMMWIEKICLPLVIGLNSIGNAILKLFGVDRSKDASHNFHSPEELQYIVKESQQGGELTFETGELLQEVFDFDQLAAHEVIVPRVKVTGIALGTSPIDLARIIKENPHTRYPVYEDTIDKIVGMIHTQDVFARLLDSQSISKTNIRSVPYVPESASLDQVLEAMRKHKTQLCVVLDEYGGTEGIITLNDLYEEVVGKIEDEATGLADLYFDAAGRLLALGTVRIEEAGEILNLPLKHEEVDTVGGLILALLGRPPQVGDKVEYADLSFEVVEMEGMAVRFCAIIRSAAAS